MDYDLTVLWVFDGGLWVGGGGWVMEGGSGVGVPLISKHFPLISVTCLFSGPHFSSPFTWTWFVMAIRGEHEIEKKEAAEGEKRGKGEGGGEIGEK